MSDVSVDTKDVIIHNVPTAEVINCKVSLGKVLLPDTPAYEDNADILSYMSMAFLNPLLKWGAKHDLQIEGSFIM